MNVRPLFEAQRSFSSPGLIQDKTGLATVKWIRDTYLDLPCLTACLKKQCGRTAASLDQRVIHWKPSLLLGDCIKNCLSKFDDELELTSCYLYIVDQCRKKPEGYLLFDSGLGDHCLYHWGRMQQTALTAEEIFYGTGVLSDMAEMLYEAGYIKKALEAIGKMPAHDSSGAALLLGMKEDIAKWSLQGEGPSGQISKQEALDLIDSLLEERKRRV